MQEMGNLMWLSILFIVGRGSSQEVEDMGGQEGASSRLKDDLFM